MDSLLKEATTAEQAKFRFEQWRDWQGNKLILKEGMSTFKLVNALEAKGYTHYTDYQYRARTIAFPDAHTKAAVMLCLDEEWYV